MEEIGNQLIAGIKGIWKYRWWSLALSWAVFAGGAAAVWMMPDTYQASARVYVDTQSVLKPLMSGMTSVPNTEQQVLIMNRTLLSRPNIERLIRMVDLDIKAKDGRDIDQLVQDLMRDIKLGGTAREDIYTITYSHRDPQLARDIVQSLVTMFVEGSIGDKKQDSQKAVAFIDDQIRSYEQKLVAAENSLKEFRIRNAGILPREGSTYAAQMADVTEQLEKARLELREAEQTRNALKRQLSGEEPSFLLDQSTVVSADAEIEGRIQALHKQLDGLQTQFTERHPDVIATKRLIAQLQQRREEDLQRRQQAGAVRANYSPVLQQLAASLAEAEARLAGARARAAEYAERQAKLKAMTRAIPEVETQLAQLNRDYQVNKENYEKLLQRREAARLSEDLASTSMVRFKIVDPPVVPAKPTGPQRPRLLALVLAAALAAGAGLGIVLSQARPTFVTALALRNATELPVLGSVSMNRTPAQVARDRRAHVALGMLTLGLLAAWALAMLRAT